MLDEHAAHEIVDRQLAVLLRGFQVAFTIFCDIFLQLRRTAGGRLGRVDLFAVVIAAGQVDLIHRCRSTGVEDWTFPEKLRSRDARTSAGVSLFHRPTGSRPTSRRPSASRPRPPIIPVSPP